MHRQWYESKFSMKPYSEVEVCSMDVSFGIR
jgi:hypothetical protein